MQKLIADRDTFRRLIAKRRAWGADRLDEVWDGVYVMSPEADNEHQNIGAEVWSIFHLLVQTGLRGRASPSCNVSDQSEKWTKNYRVPDVALFLEGNRAEDRSSHWFGGPDLAVEVMSPGDRSRKKFAFYAGVGVRELWLIDRKRWRVEVYRRNGISMEHHRTVGVGDGDVTSSVVPLRISVRDDQPRPRLVFRRTDLPGEWVI